MIASPTVSDAEKSGVSYPSWDVAKPVRHQTLTLAFRRFESCHPSQPSASARKRTNGPGHEPYDPLAQSAEHLPFKQGVRSSNLRRVTTT